MSVYGAYEKVGQLPAGVHYQIEDDGVLPNGANDGGHHDEAAMAMISRSPITCKGRGAVPKMLLRGHKIPVTR